MFPAWVYFALGSALFAGLTAFFGKIGVTGINSNLATFLRTIVVLIFSGGIVFGMGEWQNPTKLSGRTLPYGVGGLLIVSGAFVIAFK